MYSHHAASSVEIPYTSGCAGAVYGSGAVAVAEGCGLCRVGQCGRMTAQRGPSRRLLRAAFQAHGGQEVDTQGDAFFVAFPRATDAVAAAEAAQRAMAAHTWPEGVAVRVRMRLHTG